MAGHTALSVKKKLLEQSEIDALRNTTPLSDAKFNALATFIQAAMQNKGV